VPGWRGVGKTLEETPSTGVSCLGLKDGRLGRRISPLASSTAYGLHACRLIGPGLPGMVPGEVQIFSPAPKKSPPDGEGRRNAGQGTAENGLVARFGGLSGGVRPGGWCGRQASMFTGRTHAFHGSLRKLTRWHHCRLRITANKSEPSASTTRSGSKVLSSALGSMEGSARMDRFLVAGLALSHTSPRPRSRRTQGDRPMESDRTRAKTAHGLRKYEPHRNLRGIITRNCPWVATSRLSKTSR
jgi:hypothetical protein